MSLATDYHHHHHHDERKKKLQKTKKYRQFLSQPKSNDDDNYIWCVTHISMIIFFDQFQFHYFPQSSSSISSVFFVFGSHITLSIPMKQKKQQQQDEREKKNM